MSSGDGRPMERDAWLTALTEVLSRHRAEKLTGWLLVAPEIKQKKLRNVAASLELPDDEEVVGLMDATVTGSAKRSLALGVDGIYFNTLGGGETGIRQIAYSSLVEADFDTSVDSEVRLGDASLAVLAPNDDVATLLRHVAFLYEARQSEPGWTQGEQPMDDAASGAERLVAEADRRLDRHRATSGTALEVRRFLAGAWALRIAQLLEIHAHADGPVFVAPDIPLKKLRTAIERYEIPDDETVIGLLDWTALGSAKDGLLYGLRGIYLRGGPISPPGPHTIPYPQLGSADLPIDDTEEIRIGAVSFSTEDEAEPPATEILRALAGLVVSWRGALDGHVELFSVDQIDQERFERTAVPVAKEAKTKFEVIGEIAEQLSGLE